MHGVKTKEAIVNKQVFPKHTTLSKTRIKKFSCFGQHPIVSLLTFVLHQSMK